MLLIEKIDLYNNEKERDLFVYEGPSYDPKNKPLIIFGYDAHNLFDPGHSSFNKSWEVPEAIEGLGILNYLVFGVKCKEGFERIAEYSPAPYWDKLDLGATLAKPYGKKHIEAIDKVVIPYVEKKYGFKLEDNQSIMMGSSMGGVMTTYYSAMYPHKFSSYLSMSPAYWANAPHIHDFVAKSNYDAKLYFDMGGKEVTGDSIGPKEYLDNFNQMKKILKDKNIKTEFFANDIHSEECWRRRLPNALKWLLGVDE